ncbi:MAG: DegT/DnrJ/EryC1/StrS family aminotransferase [Spirochaetes bacterium]|nr:DegT/DnrJ/EryC1/StrS family aminotransferase [Spirochaetota bacterium]
MLSKPMEIPFHRPYTTEDEVNAAAECIRKGWLTMGEKTLEFENRFRDYIGIDHAVAFNSCTAALHLALHAIGLKPGDEVIIPVTTFAATAEVVIYFNARPVMVDIERDTHLIDAFRIEEKITGRTKAVIPVHFGGQPADMDETMSIAKKYNLRVIEDAAHSLPATYKNRNIGTIGDITCFSFYATKTLSTGEGGMATTRNPEWADRMRVLRLHGISRDAWKRYTKEGTWEYDVVDAGFKYNITDICSAIGIEQLKKIDYMQARRENIVSMYDSAFQNLDGLILYKIKADRKSSHHLYPVKLNLEALKISRNQFIDELKKRGIMTSVHFIPLYRFTYYQKLGFKKEDFPKSEWVFDRTISLPVYPGMNDAEIDYVIENVTDIIKSNKI